MPAIAWAGLIFALSAQPDLRISPDQALDFVLRKAAHMAVFGILALLIWRAIATTTASPRHWLAALVLTVAYAVTDELHQGFVAGRHPSPIDVAIDAAGATIALAVAGSIASRRAARHARVRSATR